MRLLILWFFAFLWISGDCEQECVYCDGRILSDDKECSTCQGDYCIYMNYNGVYSSYQNQTFSYQGCLTSPTALQTGCFRNKQGNVMCVCNDKSLCNSPETLPDVTDISYVTCTFIKGGFASENISCAQPVCRQTYSTFSTYGLECLERDIEMEMYEFGIFMKELFVPINACYSISFDGKSDNFQACLFKDNKKTKLSEKTHGKTKCYVPGEVQERMKNSTCLGQFCFSAETQYGCISQFDRKGYELKTGLYHLTPFIAPFYICDSDFCNNETVVDRGRYFYPTSFRWNSALAHGWAQSLFLSVLLCWRST